MAGRRTTRFPDSGGEGEDVPVVARRRVAAERTGHGETSSAAQRVRRARSREARGTARRGRVRRRLGRQENGAAEEVRDHRCALDARVS
jgi:hypothetical protein